MMRRMTGLMMAAALVAASFPAVAQQRADPKADLTITDPAFPKGTGPVVAIDSGHREFQTITGGFSTFAALLTNDGYKVQDFHSVVTAASLAGIKVLVIADARVMAPPVLSKDPASGFSDAEIQVLRTWVKDGGALLVCGDHPPYSTSVRALVKAFGFGMNDYAVRITGWPATLELFNYANGGLFHGPLTQGVAQVETFFGTSFTAPADAVPIMKLGSNWTILSPTPTPASDTDWRGGSLAFGKGRIVLMAETGEMTAQISAKNTLMGFNAPQATGNRRMIRNIARWLATGSVPNPAANDQ